MECRSSINLVSIKDIDHHQTAHAFRTHDPCFLISLVFVLYHNSEVYNVDLAHWWSISQSCPRHHSQLIYNIFIYLLILLLLFFYFIIIYIILLWVSASHGSECPVQSLSFWASFCYYCFIYLYIFYLVNIYIFIELPNKV